ncbi:ABC transporter substrate-binding protein [Clostridium sp. AWRP]|uniref:ABC transporter substrate-binding protein n=1 Tax=Clostridium sp. AWRP TaxID=2212991 RepID=UPI000FDA0D56|nr:ABC transporter substrate-binding protein [Clostridium sp. AWRP]AZV57539.1 extracellular solute-binding protein [Clostridium sp. AWRP]
MSKIKRILIGFLAVATISTGLLGCQQKKDAKKTSLDGEITLYTSQPEEDIQKLIQGFNKKQPGIKVKVFRSGTEEVVSKVLAEKASSSVQADVLFVSDAVTFQTLKNKDMLLTYKSPELKGINSQFIDKDNMFTGTKVISTGIVINTNKVKTEPKSFNDLLEAEAKGNVIMPSPLYSGASAYNLSVVTRTKGLGWNFYEGLKKNEVTVDKGNGGIIKAVADGQKAYGIVVDYMAVRAAKQGSPVKFIYPSEGVPVITEPIGILKTTKKAKLAQAFVDYVLSKDGQTSEASMGYAPIKSDVKAPEGLKTITELKTISGDNEELLNAREGDKKKFSSIFN